MITSHDNHNHDHDIIIYHGFAWLFITFTWHSQLYLRLELGCMGWQILKLIIRGATYDGLALDWHFEWSYFKVINGLGLFVYDQQHYY